MLYISRTKECEVRDIAINVLQKCIVFFVFFLFQKHTLTKQHWRIAQTVQLLVGFGILYICSRVIIKNVFNGLQWYWPLISNPQSVVLFLMSRYWCVSVWAQTKDKSKLKETNQVKIMWLLKHLFKQSSGDDLINLLMSHNHMLLSAEIWLPLINESNLP